MAARADELISERAEAGTGDPLTKRSPHRVTIPVMVISFQTHEEELGKRKLDIGPPVKELGELIKDVKKMDEENSPTKSQPGDTDSENESLDTSGRKAYDIITIPSPKNDEDTVVLMRARLTDANDRELTAKYGKKSKTKLIDHITRETSAEKNKDDTKIVGKTAARSVRRGDPATGGSSDATSLNKRVPQWGHTAYYYDDTIQEKGVDLWHLKMISYKPGKTMKDAENKYVAQPELGEGVDYYIFRENGASWDDENVFGTKAQRSARGDLWVAGGGSKAKIDHDQLIHHGSRVVGVATSPIWGVAKKSRTIFMADTQNEGDWFATVKYFTALVKSVKSYKKPAVINISWTLQSLPYYSAKAALDTQLFYLAELGAILTVSAGNLGPGGSHTSWPWAVAPSHPEVVMVAGAVDEEGDVTDFSETGHVNAWGPGKHVQTPNGRNGWEYIDGTSFASPIVGGIIACWMSTKKFQDWVEQYKSKEGGKGKAIAALIDIWSRYVGASQGPHAKKVVYNGVWTGGEIPRVVVT